MHGAQAVLISCISFRSHIAPRPAYFIVTSVFSFRAAISKGYYLRLANLGSIVAGAAEQPMMLRQVGDAHPFVGLHLKVNWTDKNLR